jgi:heme-degrading monooxygenase HmoA
VPASNSTADPDALVTLINSFMVAPERDEVFLSLWRRTSGCFRIQPGFVSLRLHRAIDPAAPHRFVNMVVWSSLAEFTAAHHRAEFRALVADPAFREFPASPQLHTVITD